MLWWYQHLPSFIDPVAFSIGNFSVRWYSLMWIVAFLVVYGVLRLRLRVDHISFSTHFVTDLSANALLGALLGGRIGYVLFYDFVYYVQHPLEVISPYSFDLHQWVGIYGMSYHGGIIGVIIAIYLSVRHTSHHFVHVLDFIAPAVPLGYMFGRIGNFLNHELVGRVTTSSFGMYFYDESILRYPSQLYEAIMEGLLLFILLWCLRNNKYFKSGTLSAMYLCGYAIARFCVEFVREPDAHLGFILYGVTMGQLLSGIMGLCGVLFLLWIYRDQLFARFCKK